MKITKKNLIKVIKEEIENIVEQQATAGSMRKGDIERAKGKQAGITAAERPLLISIADGLRAAAEEGNIAVGQMRVNIERLLKVLRKEGFLSEPEAEADPAAE